MVNFKWLRLYLVEFGILTYNLSAETRKRIKQRTIEALKNPKVRFTFQADSPVIFCNFNFFIFL